MQRQALERANKKTTVLQDVKNSADAMTAYQDVNETVHPSLQG
jgi:hypothetical protein